MAPSQQPISGTGPSSSSLFYSIQTFTESVSKGLESPSYVHRFSWDGGPGLSTREIFHKFLRKLVRFVEHYVALHEVLRNLHGNHLVFIHPRMIACVKLLIGNAELLKIRGDFIKCLGHIPWCSCYVCLVRWFSGPSSFHLLGIVSLDLAAVRSIPFTKYSDTYRRAHTKFKSSRALQSHPRPINYANTVVQKLSDADGD